MATDAGNILGQVLAMGQSFNVPFVKDLQYGESQANTVRAVQERLDWNKLNGSGPNDPVAATEAPKNLQEFIDGPGNTGASAPKVKAPSLMPVLVGAGGLAALFFLGAKS